MFFPYRIKVRCITRTQTEILKHLSTMNLHTNLNMKIGTIIYDTTTSPTSVSKKQHDLALEVASQVIRSQQDALIVTDSCTIDICIVMNGETRTSLNTGRFRVFWSSNDNPKIQYLGVGKGHYDGYQINRKWSHNLDMPDILPTLLADIKYYNNHNK